MLRSFGGSSSDLLTFHPLVLGFYVKSKDTNYKRLHPLAVNVLKLRHDLFGNVPFWIQYTVMFTVQFNLLLSVLALKTSTIL